MNRLSAKALVFATALLAASGSHAQTRIKLAHIQPPDDSIGIAADRFAELVKERTKGEVVVTVHPGGALGGSRELAEGIRLGTVDMIITGTPFWSTFVPVLNVLDLPYLFESREHAHAVVDGEIGTELMDGLTKHGVKGLAYYENGFRQTTNSTRAIRTPADIKGLKIRISPSKAHTKMFQLWGANPVSMNFTDVYLALQTGAIDGQENPIHIIATGRLTEVQKHLSLTRHAYSNTIIAMNLRRFNGLSPEHQKIVVDAARDSAMLQRKISGETEDKYLQQLKDNGMQVVEDIDLKLFRDSIAVEVWKDFANQNKGGQTFIDRIVAVRPKS